jgi:hypothetical protein
MDGSAFNSPMVFRGHFQDGIHRHPMGTTNTACRGCGQSFPGHAGKGEKLFERFPNYLSLAKKKIKVEVINREFMNRA